MQLSRYSDYTLRVLLYLAVRPDERKTLAQISEFFNISIEHLRKVVHQLGKMGYIKTYQGKGGGIELAGKPEMINVGEILERLEGERPVIDCEGIDCRLSNICSLSNALGRAQRAFFDTLSEYTLADLISHKRMMKELGSEF